MEVLSRVSAHAGQNRELSLSTHTYLGHTTVYRHSFQMDDLTGGHDLILRH